MFRGQGKEHGEEPPPERPGEFTALEEERLRSEELETLFTLSRIFTTSGAFEGKLSRALEELARVCQAWEVALRVPDDKARGLRVLARAGPAATQVTAVPVISFHEGLAGAAWLQGEPAVSNDYRSDPRAHPSMLAQGTKSAVAIPVQAKGRTIGVVIVGAQEPHGFTPERVRFLVAIVDGLSTILENARLQEEERLHGQELATLFTVSTILAGQDAFEEKAARLVDELVRVAQVQLVVLRVPDPTASGFRLVAKAGQVAFSVTDILPFGVGMTDAAVRLERPVISNDYMADPRALPNMVALGVRSSAALPVKSGGKVVAVLITASMEPDHFTDGRVRFLHSVVGGLGPFFENARLYDELEERNRQLEQRVREVTVLNELFQRHLTQRFGPVQNYEDTLRGIQRLVKEVTVLLEQAQSQPPPDPAQPSSLPPETPGDSPPTPS